MTICKGILGGPGSCRVAASERRGESGFLVCSWGAETPPRLEREVAIEVLPEELVDENERLRRW